uniref:Uncharacterized protein n=1 Tax=Emiliania huxleyi TaxID=2903 RepID=A0A6T0BIG8_EMIHU
MLCAAIAFSAAVSWELRSRSVSLHESKAYNVTTEEYFSSGVTLRPGHMIFTNPRKTRLEMPAGRYAITGFWGDIVDADHKPVPLSKIYDHHWVAINNRHRNEICETVPYVFGVGAESRHNPVNLPAGYGYVVDETVEWGANIHLLRIDGLSEAAAKECNECYYAPGKGKECTAAQNGTFKCCGERDYDGVGSCPAQRADLPAETFYLRYRVSYTRELAAVAPVHISVATAPDCATFYAVLRDERRPEHLAQYEFETPTDVTVLFAAGHQHVGALNISLFVNERRVCTSYPRYGAERGVAGDELGYLVQMSPCADASTGPLAWTKGDTVRIDSWYSVAPHDPRLQYSDGTHLNVMGYMYMVYTRGEDADSHSPLLRPPSPGREDPLDGFAMLQAPLEGSTVRGTRVWKRVPLQAAAA